MRAWEWILKPFHKMGTKCGRCRWVAKVSAPKQAAGEKVSESSEGAPGVHPACAMACVWSREEPVDSLVTVPLGSPR